MERLREKLKSRRGASILLALLFLLVCMMVASSVLMAAVSNAGKLRSNREEQQKYLTLSSALRLVCGQLGEARYAGRYTYGAVEVPEVTDEDGNVIQEAYTIHTYTQEEGGFLCGLNGEETANEVLLPLTPHLDALFSRYFKLPPGGEVSGDVYVYAPRTDPRTGTYRLTLTVQGGGAQYPWLAEQPVEITVEFRSDAVLYLTARLTDGDSGAVYAMQAEMEPRDEPKDLFVLAGSPAEGVPNETDEMTWILQWIEKKEAAAVGP